MNHNVGSLSFFNLLLERNTISCKPASCSEAALSLWTCVEETPCVQRDGTSVFDCLKNDPDVGEKCLAVRNAYYLCKHSQLNMRTRIRGVRVQ
jgi:Cytochrome c oxidase assembly protein PET191